MGTIFCDPSDLDPLRMHVIQGLETWHGSVSENKIVVGVLVGHTISDTRDFLKF